MSAEPIAWCFRKSLVRKLQWAKPVGGGEVTQHWTPLGDVSGLLAERDRLKAANAELAAALEGLTSAVDVVAYGAAIESARTTLNNHQGATA